MKVLKQIIIIVASIVIAGVILFVGCCHVTGKALEQATKDLQQQSKP